MIQLLASPTAVGVFQSWSGCTTVNGTACNVTVGTANINVTAAFLTKNGGACGGGSDCSSGHCVAGLCCNSACAGPCNLTCQTGTCQPQPARTACGTIPGHFTGADVTKICDGQGNCNVPKVLCPLGGGPASCDLSSNICCYNGTDRDQSCPAAATSSCSFYGQNCAATADCPNNLYCCAVELPVGFKWAICTTAANCNAQCSMFTNCNAQLCDPMAVTSGCLQGSCVGPGCL